MHRNKEPAQPKKKERKFRSFKKIKLLGRGEIANTVAGRAKHPGTNILLCSPPPESEVSRGSAEVGLGLVAMVRALGMELLHPSEPQFPPL